MRRFWRWYDRGSRVDFGGTLLSLLWDWRTWLAALLPGGIVTFLWAAIKDRDPLDVWVMAVIAFAGCVIIFSGITAAVKTLFGEKPDLEIEYDENDRRYVRLRGDHIRYYVGFRVLCNRSVDAPNLRAQEGEFTNRILAVAHDGRPYGNVEIYSGGRLDWDDLEIIELVGLPTPDRLVGADEILQDVHRFTLEARGHNVRVARAEFEYNPTTTPMIRKLS